MSTSKRIVCLANSRKLSGRCLAGKEIGDAGGGAWIRPVSSRPSREVSEYERQYPDGSDPKVLDVIDVPVLGPDPQEFQRENWTIDPRRYWRRVGRIGWAELVPLEDDLDALWINGSQTYHGANDKIDRQRSPEVVSSLALIRVDSLELRVFAPRADRFGDPKRKVQARFRHGGVPYWLSVTDPVYEVEYLRRGDGRYRLGPCYLSVSLAEPLDDACYKLVAGIMERDRIEGDQG